MFVFLFFPRSSVCSLGVVSDHVLLQRVSSEHGAPLHAHGDIPAPAAVPSMAPVQVQEIPMLVSELQNAMARVQMLENFISTAGGQQGRVSIVCRTDKVAERRIVVSGE